MGRILLLLIVSALVLAMIPMIYQFNSSMSTPIVFGAVNDQGFVQQYVSTCSQAPGIAVAPCSSTVAQQGGVPIDWTMISASPNPATPSVGEQVTFSVVITAVSSPTLPENANVGCFVDGTFVGGGTITYPGPIGYQMTVPVPGTWTATAGTHKLTCGVATIPQGLDPTPADNWASSTFTVASAPQQQFDFSISATPNVISLQPGQNQTATVSVSLLSGTSQAVSLSVSGAPSGVTASLSLGSGMPTFSSIMTVIASNLAASGNYTLTLTGSGGGQTHSTTVLLSIITPAVVTSSSSSSFSSVASNAPSPSFLNSTTIIVGVIGIVAGVGVGYGVGKLHHPSPAPIDCATLKQTLDNLQNSIDKEKALQSAYQANFDALSLLASALNQMSGQLIPTMEALQAQIQGLQGTQQQLNSEAQGLMDAGNPGNAGTSLSAVAQAIGTEIGALQSQLNSLGSQFSSLIQAQSNLASQIGKDAGQIVAAGGVLGGLEAIYNNLLSKYNQNCSPTAPTPNT